MRHCQLDRRDFWRHAAALAAGTTAAACWPATQRQAHCVPPPVAISSPVAIERCTNYESQPLLAKLLELIDFLSRNYAKIETPEGEALLLVGSVIVDLERDYTRNWRLEELADRAQMSSSSLLRVFRRATGHTPIEYLIHLRLQKAMALLRDTDQTITDVALHVGFNGGNYFWRQFKKVMGMSPTQYRKGVHPGMT